MINKEQKAKELVSKFGNLAIDVVEEIILYVKDGQPDYTGKTIGLQELQNEIRLATKELTEITDEDAKAFADSFPNKENPLHIMAVFRGQTSYSKPPDYKKIKWYLSNTNHYLFLKSKGYNVEKYL